jgi:hypothetical protein
MFLTVHPEEAETWSLTNPEESEADIITWFVFPISVVTASLYEAVDPKIITFMLDLYTWNCN